MARPLRLQLAGVLYHVTARGNRREAIYPGKPGRVGFDERLAEVADRINWSVYAWCPIGNHCHLLVNVREVAGIAVSPGAGRSGSVAVPEVRRFSPV